MELEELLGLLEGYINELKQETKEAAFKERGERFERDLDKSEATFNKALQAHREGNLKKRDILMSAGAKQEGEARAKYAKKEALYRRAGVDTDVQEGILLDQRPDASMIFKEPAVSSVVDKTKEAIKKHKSAREKENERLKSIENAQKLKQEKEKATKEYNNSVKQYLKAGKVAKGLPQTAKQVRANTQLNISKKNLEDATRAHAEAKRTHLKRKLQGDFNSLQGATETMKVLIEELGTSIGAMMDVQPINLAGKEMPSKQNNHKEKKADYRYKYRKSRSKSIVEDNNMNLDEIFEMLVQEGVSEEIAGRTCEIIEAELPSFIETAEDKQRKANNQKYMDNLKAKEARKEQDKKNMRNAVINLRRSMRGQKPLSEDTVEDIMNMVEDLISTAKKTEDEKLVSKAREVRDNERKRHNAELFHKWMKGDSRYNNVDGRYETKNEKGERETRLNSHQYDKNGFKKYNDEKALVNKSIERHNKKENK